MDELNISHLSKELLNLHRELFYVQEDNRGSLYYEAKVKRLAEVEKALDLRKADQHYEPRQRR